MLSQQKQRIMNDTLTVKNLGPIKNCEVEFGDLTFIVGPQASGKTMFLETLYLTCMKNFIIRRLKDYSYNFKNWDEFVRLYFGNTKTKVWEEFTICKINGSELIPEIGLTSDNKTYIEYIPAQRSVTVADGRFRNFNEYEKETPFVLRGFSDNLRITIQENDLEDTPTLQNIYHNSTIYIDNESMGQSKMRMKVSNADIPFSSWSMGQKEFTPLYIYYNNYHTFNDYIIIEEPELGLHPQAIIEFLNYILRNSIWDNENLKKNKLIISTHSDTIIQFVWGLSNISHINDKYKYINAVMDMLNANREDTDLQKNLDYLFNHRTNIKTYFFKDGVSKDISSLDAWSDDPDIVEWGGLTTFASRVGDIVADINAEKYE